MKQTRVVATCGKAHIQKPCPLKWENLSLTEIDSVRHCLTCAKNVHLCLNDLDAIEHAKQGDCIALEVIDGSELPDIVIGVPEVVVERTDRQREALYQHHIGRAKGKALKDAKYADRECEGCGYPVASFRKSCWVCDASNRDG